MMNNIISWIWAVVAAAIISLLINGFAKDKRKRLPPGPKGLPILGHFHLVGKNPHHDMQKLSKVYGPIMHLRFGSVDNIIASSPHAAELFLKTHDLNFASRPPNQAPKILAYGYKDLVFGQYGPFWRNMRKMCTLELLSNLKVNSFKSMRREELCLLVESFRQAKEAVDLSATLSSLSMDMSCRMVFGKTFENKVEFGEWGFKSAVHELLHLSAVPNLVDFFPFLEKLDVQGYTRRLKAVNKFFDQFLEGILQEYEKGTSTTQPTKVFVVALLEIMKSKSIEFQDFNREHVKAMILDILITSMDTSSTVVEWTMSELFKNPEILKKLKDDLERKVGSDRMVEEEDLEGLEYLEMVVKESLRLHPVVPLLLPHYAIKDCVVDGFHIPKNARIFVNVYAIARDPNLWTNSEKFIPERFSGSNIEYRGRDFEYLPFGSGRRSCPGMQLGMTTVRLVVAQLVHCFDWTLPNKMLPEELDMAESFGLVICRAKHLMAIPKYRLSFKPS